MALAEILRGLAVTAKHLLRRPVTVQFPEQVKTFAPRYHGRHQLNRYEDGLEKCIGCELCAWACPADAILVIGEDNRPDARYSPGERYGADYQINYLRCIFCGLCIEACPTRALTMTQEYDVEDDSREKLIYTKDMLLAPLPEGAQPVPHTDEQVAAREIDYYGGYARTPYLTSEDVARRIASRLDDGGFGATPAFVDESPLDALLGTAPEAPVGGAPEAPGGDAPQPD